MPARDVDAHDDRLLGLVGHDDALADLRAARAVLARRLVVRRGRVGTGRGALGLELGAIGAAVAGVALAVRLALGEALFERLRPRGRLRLRRALGGVALLAGPAGVAGRSLGRRLGGIR